MCEAVGILMFAGYLFYDMCLAGLVFFPYIYLHVKKREKEYEKKRQEKTAFSFKDGMQAVTSSLMAGYSIENAFYEALKEIELLYGKKAEIYSGFAGIVAQLNVNVTIEEAFEGFAKKSGVEEISNFSEVLCYAKRSGGDLIRIIRDTTEVINEKLEVKREISTIISAKKLEQSIMNMVPVGIVLYMRLTSGGMFDKLYGNAVGIIVMTVCLLIYFAAKMLADQIVDIQV